MTTHALAKLLLAELDVVVVVRGYEGGVNEVKRVEAVQLIWEEHKNMDFFGLHERTNAEEIAYKREWDTDQFTVVGAVEIVGDSEVMLEERECIG